MDNESESNIKKEDQNCLNCGHHVKECELGRMCACMWIPDSNVVNPLLADVRDCFKRWMTDSDYEYDIDMLHEIEFMLKRLNEHFR